MLHSRRHQSCRAAELCAGRPPSEDSGPDQPASEDSCSAPPAAPDSPSASYKVIEDGQSEDVGGAADSDAGDELLSGPSLVIGQNEMLLLEMFVSRVVQEMETRYISRLLEMDSKVDALSQLCSGLADKLDAVLVSVAAPEPDRAGGASRATLPELHSKVESLVQLCSSLVDKVDAVLLTAPQPQPQPAASSDGSAPARSPAAGHCADGPASVIAGGGGAAAAPPVIALNREAEFPDGSWLGDASNPHMRVRCKIHPLEMTRLSRHCVSAEKLAVTLLDHLFPREVLAESNISGRGKHCKKQLDPLMIYGIYCHLVTHHNVTEKEWQRIKKNLDAKCRSMWKRKQRGKPLGMGKYINKHPKRCGVEEPPDGAAKRGSPGLVLSDDAGMVVMETVPVGDVVEVEHADYLNTMELADFSNVKVIQTSMAGVRLLGGDSSELLASNNVSLHEASARGETERLQANSRQFRAVIREEPIDGKQQRLMFSSVND